jgi:hypothetical protein
MADNPFKLFDVERKPRRRFSRKNKYETIITMFCEKTSSFCRVEVTGKNASARARHSSEDNVVIL